MRPGELVGSFGFATILSYSHRDRNGIDHYHVKCSRCGTEFIASSAMLRGNQYAERCVNGACQRVEHERNLDRARVADFNIESYVAQNAANVYENRAPVVVIERPTSEEFEKCKSDDERRDWWRRYYAYRDAQGMGLPPHE